MSSKGNLLLRSAKMSNKDLSNKGSINMLKSFTRPNDNTSGIPNPRTEYKKKASVSNKGLDILRGSTFIATSVLFSMDIPKYMSPKAPSLSFFFTLYFLKIIKFSFMNLSSFSIFKINYFLGIVIYNYF